MLPKLIEESSGSERRYINPDEAKEFRQHFFADTEKTSNYSKGKVIFNQSLPKETTFTFEANKYKEVCRTIIRMHRSTVEKLYSDKSLSKKDVIAISHAIKKSIRHMRKSCVH